MQIKNEMKWYWNLLMAWWHTILPQWAAHKLPRRIAMFAFVRVHAHATCTQYTDRTPDEVNWHESLEAWNS